MIRIWKQKPEDELQYLFEIHGKGNYSKLYEILINSSTVLHNRSQLLLSLVTICMAITGFSGPKIAASSLFSRICIGYGLFFILVSTLIIIAGPLHLRWGTQRRAATLDESLIYMITIRNQRTAKYHLSVAALVIGLTGYVGSLIGYLFTI